VWSALGKIIISSIPEIIHAVELRIGKGRGAQKQDAAIEALCSQLKSLYGEELFEDSKFQEAVREYISAAVNLQNLVDKKTEE